MSAILSSPKIPFSIGTTAAQRADVRTASCSAKTFHSITPRTRAPASGALPARKSKLGDSRGATATKAVVATTATVAVRA